MTDTNVHDRILVYRLGSIGDGAVAMPLFRLIRRRYPDAWITLLTNEPAHGRAAPMELLTSGTNLFDEAVHYPAGLRDWRHLRSLRSRLRRGRYSLLVYARAAKTLATVVRDLAFFRSCGVGRIIGLPLRTSLRRPVALPDGSCRAEAARLIEAVPELGHVDLGDEGWWDLGLTPSEVSAGDGILRDAGIAPPYLAIGPGAKVEVKDWGEGKWVRLLGALAESAEFRSLALVVVGAADESARAERLLREWPAAGLNLCGRTSPRVSAAILARAALYVGHDGGPMHLAAAVGTPAVAVFSARALPGEWYPAGGRHAIIYHDVPCKGCGLDTCTTHGKRCIESVSVEEVSAAATGLIRRVGHVS